jgi:hypothetical protein
MLQAPAEGHNLILEDGLVVVVMSLQV